MNISIKILLFGKAWDMYTKNCVRLKQRVPILERSDKLMSKHWIFMRFINTQTKFELPPGPCQVLAPHSHITSRWYKLIVFIERGLSKDPSCLSFWQIPSVFGRQKLTILYNFSPFWTILDRYTFKNDRQLSNPMARSSRRQNQLVHFHPHSFCQRLKKEKKGEWCLQME